MSKIVSLFSTSLLLSGIIQAQVKDTVQTKNLTEVIVTANKLPQKQTSTGKIVTIIGKDEIEKSGGKSVAQLLNEQTGINVNGANSNPGKDKTLFMRGALDYYTVILLDGIPLNDASGLGGVYDLRLLSLSQIERIEIVKGSQSTLYGSSAIAGIINIITKKPTSSHTEGTGLLSYGSYNTMKGAADFSKKGKIFEYDVNYQYQSTKGIAEAKDTIGNQNFPKNGFTQNAFAAKLGFNVNEHFKIVPYYRYSNNTGTYSTDAFQGGTNPYNSTLVNTGLVSNYSYAKGNITAAYGYDFSNRIFSYGSYQGKFHNAEAYITHTISNAVQFIGGINFQSYGVASSDTVNTIISPYANFLFNKNGWHLELGGRFNHHNKYGNNFTYSINPSYLINNSFKVFANLSTGFRAPALSEMLPLSYLLANPNLQPETSTNFEAGIQTWLVNKKVSFTASYFNRNLNNAIVFVNTPTPYVYQYINRDKQHDQGVEVEAKYQVAKNLWIKGSYAYIYGKGTQHLSPTKDTTFYNLIRRPKNTVNLFVGYQVTKSFFVSTSIQSIGKRSDNSYDPVTYTPVPVTLKAYALWNAYAEYRILNGQLSIFADAKNLTNNTNYYEAYGYSVQGFNINGGIRFKL